MNILIEKRSLRLTLDSIRARTPTCWLAVCTTPAQTTFAGLGSISGKILNPDAPILKKTDKWYKHYYMKHTHSTRHFLKKGANFFTHSLFKLIQVKGHFGSGHLLTFLAGPKKINIDILFKGRIFNSVSSTDSILQDSLKDADIEGKKQHRIEMRIIICHQFFTPLKEFRTFQLSLCLKGYI